MQTIEELIAVMTSYKEGKTIQCADLGRDNWVDCEYPRWEWGRFDYRVKPESKLRPYANAKEFVDAMREHGPMIEIEPDTFIIPTIIECESFGVGAFCYTYSFVAENEIKWQDGTPLAIMEGVKE